MSDNTEKYVKNSLYSLQSNKDKKVKNCKGRYRTERGIGELLRIIKNGVEE